jgi:K+-transporting ATPase A subunit
MTVVKILIVVLVVAPLIGAFVQYVWPNDWPSWLGNYVAIVVALLALVAGIPRVRRNFRGWRVVALAIGVIGGAILFYMVYLMVGLDP